MKERPYIYSSRRTFYEVVRGDVEALRERLTSDAGNRHVAEVLGANGREIWRREVEKMAQRENGRWFWEKWLDAIREWRSGRRGPIPDVNIKYKGVEVGVLGVPREMTLLQIAVAFGHLDVAQLLLQHEADPNMKDSAGQNALHMAVFSRWGRTPVMIKTLLDYGVDPRIPDSGGHTPIDLLYQREQDEKSRIKELAAKKQPGGNREFDERPFRTIEKLLEERIKQLEREDALSASGMEVAPQEPRTTATGGPTEEVREEVDRVLGSLPDSLTQHEKQPSPQRKGERELG